MGWLERYRTPIIASLVVLIAVGGAVFLFRHFSLPSATEITILPPSPQLIVYVEGEVVDPGVYVLPEGDRVENAVEAAGGFTSDADPGTVNLADPLRDGEQVYIGRTGEAPQRINLNTAEAWLLEALPGIGETLARRIIDYRNDNGPFQQVEDLQKVEGIGPATLEKLRNKVTVR
jgi:competence protein ComEA